MKKNTRKFSVSKLGNHESENQDAVDINKTNKIFCVSDGASSSDYQREWASLIVQNFIQKPFRNKTRIDLKSWVGSIQKRWWDQIPWEELEKRGENFVVKAENGAHATFLGCKIRKSKNKLKLSSWAIGDSNLFIIRDEKLIKTFPMKSSIEFGAEPGLVFSVSQKDEKSNVFCASEELKSLLNYELQENDFIFAATDNLAKWFCYECEIGNCPWLELLKICDSTDFKEFIELKVNSKEIKNDDITLLILEL